MRAQQGRRSRAGFTLVEILIVVVILGILAALVVPNVSKAGDSAVKSSINRQLQSIYNQIELYRTMNANLLPTSDPVSPMGEGGANDGWGILVSEEYFAEPPMNPFTSSPVLAAGTHEDAVALVPGAGQGWLYESTVTDITIHPAGYDRETDTLSTE